jgi:hypothetical protein
MLVFLLAMRQRINSAATVKKGETVSQVIRCVTLSSANPIDTGAQHASLDTGK